MTALEGRLMSCVLDRPGLWEHRKAGKDGIRAETGTRCMLRRMTEAVCKVSVTYQGAKRGTASPDER
ncbi:hypothetical protein D3Z60_14800 [Lachnospiraceae bacterium]|nr:hypothetical protein [Lachnospiraceae bacterium]